MIVIYITDKINWLRRPWRIKKILEAGNIRYFFLRLFYDADILKEYFRNKILNKRMLSSLD